MVRNRPRRVAADRGTARGVRMSGTHTGGWATGAGSGVQKKPPRRVRTGRRVRAGDSAAKTSGGGVQKKSPRRGFTAGRRRAIRTGTHAGGVVTTAVGGVQ